MLMRTLLTMLAMAATLAACETTSGNLTRTIQRLSDGELLSAIHTPYFEDLSCRSDRYCTEQAMRSPPTIEPRLPLDVSIKRSYRKLEEARRCEVLTCSAQRRRYDSEQRLLMAEAIRRGLVEPAK